ncbi:response regulator [Salinimonas marina]|uniref:histidine kinase n=1 Tax=Salinimonas marina TaxID=2785918 RepID=A0A7S9DZQ5_9ALTE|nr:ATP-binding protein [Salinimonas marina]QPG06355.1 response regulator [Salinimonas marina]
MKSAPSGNASINLVLIVICLCTVLVVVIAFGEHQLRNKVHELAAAEQKTTLDEVNISLQKRIGGYLNDIQFVYETPPIEGMEHTTANAGQKNIDGVSYTQWRMRLQTIFEAFMRHNLSYRELRFIRADGEEQIRTLRSNGGINSLAERQLRQLGGSEFFDDLLQLEENQIRITPIRPAQLNEVVVYPVIPVLDISLPVYQDNGLLLGYLSSTIDLTDLLSSLQYVVRDYHKIVLANADNSVFYISSQPNFFDTNDDFNIAFAQQYINTGEIDKGVGLNQYQSPAGQAFIGSSRPVKLGAGRTEYKLLSWVLIDEKHFMETLNEQRMTLYSVLFGVCLVLVAVALLRLRTARGRHTLAETQAEAQVLFDNSQNGIVIIKKGDVITNCNQQFIEQCHLSQSKIIGSQLQDILDGRVPQSTLTELLAFEQNELKDNFLIEWQQKGKSALTYRCHTSFIEVNGVVNAVALIFQDITEELRVRFEIEQANNQLEEKIARRTQQLGLAHEEAVRASEFKSKFISNISHEMRTPLNGVVGSLSLMSKLVKDEEALRFLAMAQTSAKNLNALINDVLDLSKIEAGKLEIEAKAFSPLSLIEGLVTSMSIKAQEKGLQLFLDTSALHFVSFTQDPHRLTQIINNLLSNAIKFTNEGAVTIRVASTTENGQQGRLQIEVADTGVGINQQDQPKLFNSFSQADKTIASKYGGTGLGLSICKQLCKLMDGEISLQSDYGKGTTVSFYISSSTWQNEPVDATQRLHDKRVAIFTNNQQEHEMLVNMVTGYGGQLMEYADVTEIPLQGDALPEVIIIDAHAMEFRELLLHLQSCPDEGLTQTTKIVLLQQTTRPVAKHSLSNTSRLTRPLLRSEFFAQVCDQRTQTNSATTERRRDIDQFGLSETQARKKLSGQRLVVVDDNEINLEVAASMLRAFYIVVEKARDGKEAIEVLKRLNDQYKPVAAILMDCNMPCLDGYETTTAIRAGHAGKRIQDTPVIAMTANAMRGEKEKCLQAGMNDYISEPLAMTALMEKLIKWCEPGTTAGSVNLVSAAAPSPVTESTEMGARMICFDKPGALSRLMNNETLLKKLVGLFIDDSSEKLQQLSEAVNSQDYESVRQASHALKGQAGDIGAIDLHRKLYELEAIAKKGNKPVYGKQVEVIEHAYKELITELQNYLAA